MQSIDNKRPQFGGYANFGQSLDLVTVFLLEIGLDLEPAPRKNQVIVRNCVDSDAFEERRHSCASNPGQSTGSQSGGINADAITSTHSPAVRAVA